MKLSKWIVLLLLIVLTACSTTTPTAAPAVTPTQGAATAAPADDYPAAPAAAADANYPAPTDVSPAADTAPAPTVDPTLGQVKGVLIEAGLPVAHVNLYLAELLKSEVGEDVAYAFVREQAPNATTNEKGEFTFVNVPPNTYAVIYDVGIKQVLLLNPADGVQIKIVVENGKTNDLGVLKYDQLPK